MSDADLLETALSTKEDLYGLFSIPSSTPLKGIQRAYRKTALKYHPDKNRDNPIAVEKFHTLTDALAILSNDEARKAYDGRLAADQKRKEATAAMDQKRRKIKDDLERREQEYRDESLLTRKREKGNAEKVEKLGADGRRRMEELKERRKRRMQQEEINTASPATVNVPNIVDSNIGQPSITNEIWRTIRVRWALEGPGLSVTKNTVEVEFSKYGKVSTIIFPESDPHKPYKARLYPAWKHRKQVAKAFVVYESVVGASHAVESASAASDPNEPLFPEVTWAQGAPPPGLSKIQVEESTTKERPAASSEEKKNQDPNNVVGSEESVLERMKRAAHTQNQFSNQPQTGSFPSGSIQEPSTSSFPGTHPPVEDNPGLTFEEITLIRMRRAGRAQEEERIRREEAEDPTEVRTS